VARSPGAPTCVYLYVRAFAARAMNNEQSGGGGSLRRIGKAPCVALASGSLSP
jgi:hypothetical protein